MAVGNAQICPGDCPEDLPEGYGGGCDTLIRSGGIEHIVVTTCDVPQLSTLTKEQICAYVAAGKIKMTPILKGELGDASETKEELSGCRPQYVSGYEWTLAFNCKIAGVDFSDYKFWNQLKVKYLKYNFYFTGCGDQLYGAIPKPTFSASYTIPGDSKVAAYWRGNIGWQGFEDLEPVLIPGLIDMLSGACDAQGGTCGTIQSDYAISGFELNLTPGFTVNNADSTIVFYGCTPDTNITSVTLEGFPTEIQSLAFTTPLHGAVQLALLASALTPTGTYNGEIVIETDCCGTIRIPTEFFVGPTTGTGFKLDNEPDLIKITQGDVYVDSNAIAIVREAGCTGTVTIQVLDVEVISGGPNATGVNFDLLTTGVDYSNILLIASSAVPGTYRYHCKISGCGDSYTFSFDVKVEAPIDPPFDCTSTTLTLTATVTAPDIDCNTPTGNGLAPYMYRLDGGIWQTSNKFLNVAAGAHTLQARDSRFCMSNVLNVTV